MYIRNLRPLESDGGFAVDFSADESGKRQYIDLMHDTPFSTTEFESFVVTFNGSTFKFYRNGVLWGSRTPTKLYAFTQIVFGAANWIIDDLRISNIARSDEEILAAYESNQPLPVDQYTTLKLGFDGPDGQRGTAIVTL